MASNRETLPRLPPMNPGNYRDPYDDDYEEEKRYPYGRPNQDARSNLHDWESDTVSPNSRVASGQNLGSTPASTFTTSHAGRGTGPIQSAGYNPPTTASYTDVYGTNSTGPPSNALERGMLHFKPASYTSDYSTGRPTSESYTSGYGIVGSGPTGGYSTNHYQTSQYPGQANPSNQGSNNPQFPDPYIATTAAMNSMKLSTTSTAGPTVPGHPGQPGFTAYDSYDAAEGSRQPSAGTGHKRARDSPESYESSQPKPKRVEQAPDLETTTPSTACSNCALRGFACKVDYSVQKKKWKGKCQQCVRTRASCDWMRCNDYEELAKQSEPSTARRNCGYCSTKLLTIHRLAIHIRDRHEKRTSYSCDNPFCAKIYDDYRALSNHLRMTHNQFPCNLCRQNTFPDQKELDQHQRTCDGVKW